jgi:hypothetical protein
MLIDMRPFVAAMQAENEVLRKNGAAPQAQAREALLEDLLSFMSEAESETVDVGTAAKLARVDRETVLRAVRNEEIPDIRPEGGRGKGSAVWVRKADIPLLAAKSREKRRGRVDKSDSVSYNVEELFRDAL